MAGTKPQSQFGRALRELGVELIAAHSPQAKGRVERLFKTLQDRVVKELRLAGIATMEDANRFMEGYLPRYNRRFAVPPDQKGDLHRPKPLARDLARCLCIKTPRCLRKDLTIAHAGQLYQIHDTVRATHVQVEDQIDGTRRITHHGRVLGFHVIAARPVPVGPVKTLPRSHRPVTPRPTHPWRTRWRAERDSHTGTTGP